MITGMDRLIAAINGEKSDRIPVFCNLLDQGAAELGISSLKEYYGNGEHVAEAQLKMREKYGHDNVWSLFYVGKEAELLGCEKIVFSKGGPPNVEDFVIKSYDDIVNLEIPDDLAAMPAFAENLKCLNILKREVGGKQPICAYITAGMTLPAILMGMDKWLELLLLGPTDIRDLLLEKCSDFFQKEIKAFRDNGADVCVYSNPFGSTDFVSMKQFDALSMPWMKRDIEPGGVAGLVYYCGSSRFNKVIDRVIKELGIGVFYLSPKDDIAEAKKIINGRALTCGVINDIKLVSWSREEIRAEVKRMCEAGMPGGKFLFGTLVMPYDIPEQNIRAMLEAAYEYGSY
ncbi:uroporphyrinogen decarboxylase [Mariprofundus sp. NF]|uniref:uroporphyrinogen decarboxylase family protein n=1 Tax=Mariprofundus sp. NF TaxID=2608716 RepID=UPI0015A0C669|nr:uroporphyrinogen decarboxylase family protein [Mariprofundus sp. NF]NWF38519.1 uroporphyrinogen decarboxylase [Mariprofundus sp. NF]